MKTKEDRELVILLMSEYCDMIGDLYKFKFILLCLATSTVPIVSHSATYSQVSQTSHTQKNLLVVVHHRGIVKETP